MKKMLSLVVVFMASMLCAYSQPIITVQSGTNATFYTSLTAAIAAAPSGSTITLSPGNYAGDITINKKLYIYGAGHQLDSGNTLRRSTITGSIRLNSGSDSSIISGFYITNSIMVQYSIQLTKILILRCNLLRLNDLTENTGKINNSIISENVFREYMVLNNSQNIIIEKNIISGYILSLNGNAIIRNNLFLGTYFNNQFYLLPMRTVYYANIYNNIFVGNINHPYYEVVSKCTFQNNTISYAIDFGDNNNVNNKLSITYGSLYSSTYSIAFNYAYNYHLKDSCVGKNFGTDGTDVGIYGTSTPFKENFAPVIPNIKSVDIPTETTNGKLRVKMTVEAQQR
jgi:hypothetical protein